MNKNTVIGVLVAALVVLGGFVFWQNNKLHEKETALKAQNAAVGEEKVTAPTPDRDGVYIGTYNNEIVVFGSDVYATEPYKVMIKGIVGPVDFRDIKNPKKVYTFKVGNDGGPTSLLLSKNKDVVYATFNHDVYTGPGSEPYTDIVKIDTNDNTNSIVWTNKGDTLQEKGPIYLTNIYNDNYLLFMLAGCYACGGGYSGSVMFNLKTEKHIYISDDIGNVQVNEAAGTYSYQRKIVTCTLTNTCDGEPYPETKPYGKIFTEKLP